MFPNERFPTKHKIISVDADSPAEHCGAKGGWSLLKINDSPVYDVIDYEQLTACERLKLIFETDTEDEIVERHVRKALYEPLGLNFKSSLMSPVRQCANHCIFCFIDQMPHGNRGTLYFKDDDWRLSLIMGNYVTLTNVSEAEFTRIIERRVSPLYISVHASDGDVRKAMMRSKNSEAIMKRLTALHEAGLKFHCQIVLCPGYNDRSVLERTINDLYALRPECVSIAVVPVGLTSHREGLTEIPPVTAAKAAETIRIIEDFRHKHGLNNFVYASDEMYLCAGIELPSYDDCGDFQQIENGVGLFRWFERGFDETLEDLRPLENRLVLDSASGVSIAPHMQRLFDRLLPYNIEIRVHPVNNDFFGHGVTVSGLLTARDIIAQLHNVLNGDALILPHTMLRENDIVFLDGMTLPQLSEALSKPVFKVSADDGSDMICEVLEIAHKLSGTGRETGSAAEAGTERS